MSQVQGICREFKFLLFKIKSKKADPTCFSYNFYKLQAVVKNNSSLKSDISDYVAKENICLFLFLGFPEAITGKKSDYWRRGTNFVCQLEWTYYL